MTHFKTEQKHREHVQKDFEALVDQHGIEAIHAAVSDDVMRMRPHVSTQHDVNVTVFSPCDAEGMPMKGKKIMYRKALSHGKALRLVGARSGARQKLVLVFDPNIGEKSDSENGALSLPSSMRDTSWRTIGVEVTAKEMVDVFDGANRWHIFDYIKKTLQTRTGAGDPRFEENNTDDMPDDWELAKEGFGAW